MRNDIRTRDELLRLMYEQAEDYALILLDPRGVVVAWMMGATKLFGHGADEMVGRTLEGLFTPEDEAAGARESELEHARRSDRAEDDRWMVRSDGVRFWASGFVHSLRDARGAVVGFAKVLRDRTDVRGQIEALRNRVDALAAEENRQVVMFGTLAHELRNPLGAVTNAVHLIDATYPGDPKLSYALQLLRRQVGYVSTLINDLLEVTRARTGKAVLRLAPLELKPLVDESLQTVDAELRGRGQRVEVLLPTAPVTLYGDRVRLTQVFINLLTNASKFSEPDATIWIKATVEADEAVVRVEDHGRGIPAAMLPHVFDLLSQAEHEPADRSRGLGLGLAIVKEYVELHGGVVQVRSEGIGRGSEFTVRLPLTQPAASP